MIFFLVLINNKLRLFFPRFERSFWHRWPLYPLLLSASESVQLDFFVPQGSVLSPQLFSNIHIPSSRNHSASQPSISHLRWWHTNMCLLIPHNNIPSPASIALRLVFVKFVTEWTSTSWKLMTVRPSSCWLVLHSNFQRSLFPLLHVLLGILTSNQSAKFAIWVSSLIHRWRSRTTFLTQFVLLHFTSAT